MVQRLRTIACIAVLFGGNAFTCRELFHAGFIHTMGSAEGAYIAMIRYASENWRDLAWFPLWFSGMPWNNVYQPAFPLIGASLVGLLGVSPAVAYHAVTAVAYCAVPATVFLLCYGFTRSRAYGMTVGLLYSSFSPSVILPGIRHDMGSVFDPRRYQGAVHYGEGPHTAVLAMLPVAILWLHRAVSDRRPLYWVLAPFSIAAILLTNWPGSVGLLLAIGAYACAMLASRSPIHWPAFAAVLAIAYGLAYPWIPPSTLKSVITASQYANGAFPFSVRHVFFVLGLVLVLAFALWIFRRSPISKFGAFSLLFLGFTSVIPVTNELTGFALLPQPHRFHLEMEIAILIAVCYLLWHASAAWPAASKRFLFGGLIVFSAVQIWRFRKYAIDSLKPLDIQGTSEYKVADWFQRHMPGLRVFVPGSDSIWINVFTDTPQIGGCCDQGVSNFQSRIALHVVYTGQNAGASDAQISVLWLKAFGAHAVAVSGPRSTEPFKPFAHPHKFDGVLTELWRDEDDTIYQVPNRTGSLAHVINRDDAVSSAPAHGLDVGPLLPYVSALDDERLPPAQFKWTSRHSTRITAPLSSNQLVSVQISYDPHWRAIVNRSPRRIRSDALGLMLIEPECGGSCLIELDYDLGEEMVVTRAVQIASFIALLIGVLVFRQTQVQPSS